MINLAGNINCDEEIREELRKTRINVVEGPKSTGEVPASLSGELCGWKFHRAWYYWVAEGPALPFEYADPLHERIGKEVRVAGHCGCPSPREWYKGGGGVTEYHVDTQLGLYLLAEAIIKADEDNKLRPTHTHVTRDIELVVLEEGDDWVRFKVIKYDKDPGPGENSTGIDVLSKRVFNVLFKPVVD